MNVRWSGFADLTFASSARLAFSRALERAETDVNEHQAQAWVIEDRRISFSIDAETSPHVLEGTRRLLGALVLDAVAGEAVVEVTTSPAERWSRKAALSISKEITVGEDYDGAGETIRTEAS